MSKLLKKRAQKEEKDLQEEDKRPSAKESLKDPEFRRAIKRILALVFKLFPVRTTIVIITYMTSVIANLTPAIFMQKALMVIEQTWKTGDWAAAQGPITLIAIQTGCVLLVGTVCHFIYNQIVITLTQGTARHIRNEMFGKMEKLPISYFDTNQFGEIMSRYTNDVDALRMFLGSGVLTLLSGLFGILGTVAIMFYYSLWLTLIELLSSALIFAIVGYLGSRTASYYKAQQKQIGVVEGFIEETMSGLKTVKVFTHEPIIQEEFNELNEELFLVSRSAGRCMGVLPPALFNTGNIIYVIIAICGSSFIYYQVPNVSISGLAFSIATVVPFLNMTKSLTGNIGTLAQGINPVLRGGAGAQRIFELIDETPESDTGRVTLVNCQETSTDERSWKWQIPQDLGEDKFIEMQGDIQLEDVVFGYKKDQPVLKGISVHAKPGQKVAFVGATGAGKTTITNLLNRFYDIDSGSIRYDSIDIKDMKKDSLRKSLGMVLQDTNLFNDTVMENIRFGNPDAADEDCIAAAKLSGADDFVAHLPRGYQTVIKGDGTNFSQGQRQLLSIARAAVANPPVMILDEATSSIDTRTENLVQMGMDNLMKGRTTFVIAHRLSTVRNADLICVLDHGEIIEMGDHNELIQKHGTYYQLYTGAFELE